MRRTYDSVPTPTQMRAAACAMCGDAEVVLCVEIGRWRVAANDGIYVPASTLVDATAAAHALFSCDITRLDRCTLRYHGVATARDVASARVERRFARDSVVPNRHAPLRVDSIFLRATAAAAAAARDADVEAPATTTDIDVPRIFIYDGAPLDTVNAYVLATAPLERLRALVHLQGVYTSQWWLGAHDDGDVVRDRVATLVLVVALCRAPERTRAWYVRSEQRVLRLQLSACTRAQTRALARHVGVGDEASDVVEQLVAAHGTRLDALMRAAAASRATRVDDGDVTPLLADAVRQCSAFEFENRFADEDAYLTL